MSVDLHPGSFTLKTTALRPFGLVLQPMEGTPDVRSLSSQELRQAVVQHRLLVLRGFQPFPTKEALSEYANSWGELLRWEFGTVFEVVEHDDPQNYLFTSGSVPYHWDGAFAAQVPWLQVFQCLESPGDACGGETLFCDTVQLYADLSPTVRNRWDSIVIDYFNEKVAHYGGNITAPLIGRHPHLGIATVRFAEPANETTVPLNTPQLQVRGCKAAETTELVNEMRGLLYDPRYLYAHSWQQGDLVIADNHALLHGRSAYHRRAPRRLWRVHVL